MKEHDNYYYEGKSLILDRFFKIFEQEHFSHAYDLFITTPNPDMLDRINNLEVQRYSVFQSTDAGHINTWKGQQQRINTTIPIINLFPPLFQRGGIRGYHWLL